MDIVPGDKDKHLIRIAAWWLRKKYKTGNKDQIHEDMINCGNPVIRKLYKKITKISKDNIKAGYQKDTINELSELALWIIERDTAYRDPFFYILKEILDMKDEIYDEVIKYYKKPKDWYVNRWIETKNNTREGKKSGKVLPHSLSQDETYFVPSIQKERFKEISELDEILKNKKRRRTAW